MNTQITKKGIWKADGTESTGYSYTSGEINETYTTGIYEKDDTARILDTEIQANQFYEI